MGWYLGFGDTEYEEEEEDEEDNEEDDDSSPLIDTTSSNSFLWNNKKGGDKDKKAPPLSQLESQHLIVIIDGETLTHILGVPAMEELFLSLTCTCKSVLACRTSPEQKRLLVKLVKKGVKPTPVTLAIGDGANDVSMIQEAQVGIGISGREGTQAVNASDFAIAQFRFLERLLLVHGQWDYKRTSRLVMYSFYKNIVLTMVLFFYTFFSGNSGQSLFEDNIYSSYNIILALPVVAFGVFDVDVSAVTLLKFKFLYKSGAQKVGT